MVFGIKKEITQAWDNQGRRLVLSVIATEPMVVTQVKSRENDGYEAVQVGFGVRRKKNVTKPELNHLQKANLAKIPRYLREIQLEASETYKVGDSLKAETILHEGDLCAVTGTTKGRGFSGVMKRWGFKGGPKTHGQSDRWRAPGSIGQGTSPGRVHKGKKMAGHYGMETKWLKNIKVVKIDEVNQEIWLRGPVPGKPGSIVMIKLIRSGEPIKLTELKKLQDKVVDKEVNEEAVI